MTKKNEYDQELETSDQPTSSRERDTDRKLTTTRQQGSGTIEACGSLSLPEQDERKTRLDTKN